MIRLLIYLFTRRWGLIILGSLCAIFGLILGVSSHQVRYVSVNRETVEHFLYSNSSSGDNSSDAYLQMANDPNLYVVHMNAFSPAINTGGSNNSFGDGNSISFIYRPDDTTSIDVSASNSGAHLQGDAYSVEQITLLDNNGQPVKVFTNSEYAQNPHGFYENNWPAGIGLLLAGLIVIALAVFVPKLRRRNQGASAGFVPATPVGMPAGVQPPMNPYQQPYQGPAQYPQQSGQYYPPTQYPPQPGQYGPPFAGNSSNQPGQYPQPGSNEWNVYNNP